MLTPIIGLSFGVYEMLNSDREGYENSDENFMMGFAIAVGSVLFALFKAFMTF